MSIKHRTRRAIQLASATRGHNFLLRNLRPPFPFWIKNKKFELVAPNTDGTRCTYSEVIPEDAYKLKNLKEKNVSLIVDIGANVGFFSCYTSALFPKAEVFAFEPNKDAFSYLSRNAMQFPKLNVNNKAVSCTLTTASLTCSGESVIGTIGPSTPENEIVECIHPRDIAPSRQIDLLKIDCEGSEFDILSDSELLRRTRHCRIEFHLDEKHTLSKLLELIKLGRHRVVATLPKELAGTIFGYLYTELTVETPHL